MNNFKTWLENDTYPSEEEMNNRRKNVLGAKEMTKGLDAMAERYAKRIINGEDPNVVLQGVGKAIQDAVNKKIQEIKNPQPTQENPQQNNQVSVSQLEQEFGMLPGSLSLEPSRDKQWVFVRNRKTGKSVNAKPDLASIKQAIPSIK